MIESDPQPHKSNHPSGPKGQQHIFWTWDLGKPLSNQPSMLVGLMTQKEVLRGDREFNQDV